jgi:hypothetical protein
MKTLCVALFFLTATAAFGQSSVGVGALSAEPVITEFSSHSLRAAQTPMATQESLLEVSEYVVAHGERPLWEVGTLPRTVPLGDSARVLRKEHETAKKAEIIWQN